MLVISPSFNMYGMFESTGIIKFKKLSSSSSTLVIEAMTLSITSEKDHAHTLSSGWEISILY